MRKIPFNDAPGESLRVESTKMLATITKSIGTQGYPRVRYGRGKFGIFFRNTITAAVVIPYKIQLAKITYVYNSSYWPDKTSSADQTVSINIDCAGVWYRGWTFAIARKK